MEIKQFAQQLQGFFQIFDAFFLDEPEKKRLLARAKKTLEEKILRNESALPVIMALGGRYDSNIDKAKMEELGALVELIQAREALRTATVEWDCKERDDQETLRTMFDI